MKLNGKAKQLKLYLGETDQYKGQALYHEITLKAKDMDMAGVTVYKGIEGFGAASRIHTINIFNLSDNLPVMVELIDTEIKINKFIEVIENMITKGILITVKDLEVIKYSPAKK